MRLPPLLLLAPLAWLGCGDKSDDGGDEDDDAGGGPPEAVDADDDGFTSAQGDCDDADPEVHPAAEERCNELDDDCDGLLDEADDDLQGGFLVWEDADGDGYGDDEEGPQRLCEVPTGWVGTAGDCDDAEPAVHPGADEVCNGVDDDCDGNTDGDALDLGTWYTDADGDGFGDDATVRTSCEAASDEVAEGGDCDDGLAAVHPEATEVCGDGLDNDCDGAARGCGPAGLLTEDDVDLVLWGDSGDQDGHASLAMPDWDGDGYDELFIGSPKHDGVEWGVGRIWRLTGPTTGVLSTGEAAEVVAEGTLKWAAFGYSLDWGDLDDSGTPDLVVGVQKLDGQDLSWGGALIMAGPVSGTLDAPEALATIQGEEHTVRLGTCGIHGQTDLTGDGIHDLALSACEETTYDAGATYVFEGPLAGSSTVEAARATLFGTAAEDLLGQHVEAADVDGDGIGDLLVGSEYYDADEEDQGGVYVLLGPVTGSRLAEEADIQLLGAGFRSRLGAVDTLGDLDGDGQETLALGEHCAAGCRDEEGAVFLIEGVTSGTVIVEDEASARIYGDAQNDHLGTYLQVGGDVNGDGEADLWVVGAGGTFLFTGPLSGDLSAGSASTAFIDGLGADDYALAGGSDLDGDGADEVAISHPNADNGGDSTENNGATFILFGGPGY